MMSKTEMWSSLGSAMAAIMFVSAMFQNYFPQELRGPIKRFFKKLRKIMYPYMSITFPEYQGNGFQRSKAFIAIERYLEKHSSNQAKRLKASVVRDCDSVVLSMQDYEEVIDEFEGIKIWWASRQHTPNRQSISFYPREEEKRYFTLSFHERYRETIINAYLTHVLKEGKEITARQRQRKLYTNNKNDIGYRRSMWSHVVFEHPATFDTLAMDPNKKQEIIDDLITFSKAKDYYAKIGKAWKRGYLLYGPPGTGKSSMIAAVANFLNYDIYDVELTSVKDNTELRKLLIDTSSKSIIVIEDIDCSLDLTGQREKKAEEKDKEKEKGDKASAEKEIKNKMEESNKDSKVTLSGLLNFIDGLWSSCGGERLIVFTTNYVEKLDPALIRKGRMDKHIELSYCGYEAFKLLAKNYLNIESNDLFPTIGRLLEETNMAPADVAENLMPKSSADHAETCLERLIKAIEEAKEEARLKAEEEERLKAEKEEKDRAEKEKKKEDEDNNRTDEANAEAPAKEGKENGDITKTSEKEVKQNGNISKE